MASYSTTTSSIREDNERILDKNFTIIINSHLGKGGFGQVFLGRYLKENMKIYGCMMQKVMSIYIRSFLD